MRIAVLTLTRDRASYTRHCFNSLLANAGCDFDHYVLDQASEDDTLEVLAEYRPHRLLLMDENIGVTRGLNTLLDVAGDDYDVYVKFDNDCELVTADTLKTVSEVVHSNPNWLISPHIHGLQNPPSVAAVALLNGQRVGVTGIIGGIFLAASRQVFVDHGYRHNPANPLYGNDDVDICQWLRTKGGSVGYLLDFPAWHYKTTDGQQADLPDYFTRKFAEMGI